MLNERQRRQLLTLARESIAAVLEGRTAAVDRAQFDATLREPSGAFVTLTTREDDLRGCIGSIAPVAPLFEAVAMSAVNAAIRDPRFYPVRQGELAALKIEISVMGPIEQVANVGEIEVGRDGLIIRRGPDAGLLLPQVATDYGWDRETFLRQTCVKAGLPPEAWRAPGTTIEKFSAEVFGEEELSR
jgi:AmmeMemoRadiSam system protein A